MPAVLRIIEGPQTGASCEVRPGQRAVLGRGERADLPILDGWASRAHCAVVSRPEGLFLEDLRSKNGTYLSGRRVEAARLGDGALIQIGTTTVQVLLRPVGAATAVLRERAPRRLRAALYVGIAGLCLVGLAYGGAVIFGGGPGESLAALRARLGSALDGLLGRGPRVAAVGFTSEPSGASVFIDDEFCGVTPVEKADVTAGEHALRVQKAGYEVHRDVLSTAEAAAKPVHVVLRVSGRGALAVTSRPEGASVYLDSEYRGKTPLRLDGLDPHTYGLRLEMPNFADWQRQVAVRPAETVPVEATLGHREIGYYLTELKSDPNNVSCHTEVAHLYLLEQKVDEAIAHLTRAIEITLAGQDSTRPEPYTARLIWLIQKIYLNDHFRYGDEAFVQRVRARVESMFGDIAARHPSNSLLREMAERLGRQAGTRGLINAILQREREGTAVPAGLDATLQTVARLEQQGQHPRAVAVLQQALVTYPNEYRIYLRLGRVHLLAKDQGVPGARERAIEALNAALIRCPNEAAREEVRRLLGLATR